MHGVDVFAGGGAGQDAVIARDDQPRRVAPALQERLEVPPAPGVVHHKQDAALAQGFGERRARRMERREPRRRAGQADDEVGNCAEEIVGPLAELRPETPSK